MKVKISFGGRIKEFKLIGEADMSKIPKQAELGLRRIMYLQGPRGACYKLNLWNTGNCSFMDKDINVTWLSLNQVEFIEEN